MSKKEIRKSLRFTQFQQEQLDLIINEMGHKTENEAVGYVLEVFRDICARFKQTTEHLQIAEAKIEAWEMSILNIGEGLENLGFLDRKVSKSIPNKSKAPKVK